MRGGGGGVGVVVMVCVYMCLCMCVGVGERESERAHQSSGYEIQRAESVCLQFASSILHVNRSELDSYNITCMFTSVRTYGH